MKLNFLPGGSLTKAKESKLFLRLVPGLKDERTKKFTTLSLTLATIIFFGLFAISPTLGTVADLQKQISDNQFVSQQLQGKITNLNTLQTTYTNLQANLTPLYDAIPKDLSLNTFVGQLHTLAQQNNVSVTRVQTFPVDITDPLPGKYTTYAFSVEVVGLLPDISHFVASVGSFNRLISFDVISVSSAGRIDNSFRAVIRGKAYFKAE